MGSRELSKRREGPTLAGAQAPKDGTADASPERLGPYSIANLVEIEKAVLGAFLSEFAQLDSRYRALDSRAQATAGISGVFIGASFAFVRAHDLAKTSPFDKGIFLAMLMMLLASVFLAILAMRVRRVVSPPSSVSIRQLADNLIKNVEPSHSPLLGFFNEQTYSWERTIKSFSDVVRRKAIQVESSQYLLALALIILTLATAKEIIQ